MNKSMSKVPRAIAFRCDRVATAHRTALNEKNALLRVVKRLEMRPLRVALLLGSTRDGPPRPLLGRRVGKRSRRPSRPATLVACTPSTITAPSPALLHVLNHFGSSLFSFKPSLIVSYSAGQWGGVRAANALRPILSELGALPVSAMIHVPKAGEAFDEDGAPREDADRWAQYADRGVAQLEWWATAAREHRSKVDPTTGSPAFTASPSQRNAP
ncbi:hypothetical protein JL722_14669 [Aureococcus anophagefferens]|nr:hypothetical protein JL722_14669 [Aureococcus anophagefferens]